MDRNEDECQLVNSPSAFALGSRALCVAAMRIPRLRSRVWSVEGSSVSGGGCGIGQQETGCRSTDSSSVGAGEDGREGQGRGCDARAPAASVDSSVLGGPPTPVRFLRKARLPSTVWQFGRCYTQVATSPHPRHLESDHKACPNTSHNHIHTHQPPWRT